jgi:AraC-like DNA-binding protein
MKPNNSSTLIVCNDDDRYMFNHYLKAFDCEYKNSILKVREILRQKHFDNLLLYTKIDCSREEEMVLRYLSEHFPNLNSVAVVKKDACKLSHFLGVNGIKRILHNNEIDELSQIFSGTTGTRITIDKFKISLDELTPQAQKILYYIERNYLTIFTITDIANYAGINECTITREFQKNNLCPPKRLLMYFKVMHSVELLKNSDLKIKEIADISGFTNEQRYIECFGRVHSVSPTEFRNKAR